MQVDTGTMARLWWPGQGSQPKLHAVPPVGTHVQAGGRRSSSVVVRRRADEPEFRCKGLPCMLSLRPRALSCRTDTSANRSELGALVSERESNYNELHATLLLLPNFQTVVRTMHLWVLTADAKIEAGFVSKAWSQACSNSCCV